MQSPVNSRQAATFEAPELTYPEERQRLFSQRDHVRVSPDLKDRLEEAGFLVAVTRYTDELPPGGPAQRARAEAEAIRNDLYFCRPA